MLKFLTITKAKPNLPDAYKRMCTEKRKTFQFLLVCYLFSMHFTYLFIFCKIELLNLFYNWYIWCVYIPKSNCKWCCYVPNTPNFAEVFGGTPGGCCCLFIFKMAAGATIRLLIAIATYIIFALLFWHLNLTDEIWYTNVGIYCFICLS